ncbi:MAG: class I SAM-dependent methyltransferase [Elusimicrobiota bacterium]|nr:MAG: class I SAM-dependent methyltransferase [Elusimicrobiota bacterium]
MSGRLPSIYADPALYDLIHADGTDDEVWFLDTIAKDHGCGIKTALEPACGTGRYLAGLLRRGYTVEGYDAAGGMLDFARKRLKGWGKRARVFRGEMSTYRPKGRYGLILNLLSTFRHLMTDKEALAHLKLMAGALEPGGIFVLGLDLSIYGEDVPDEEVWDCRQGGRRAKHVVMSIPPEPGTRREKIINFVTEKKRLLESSYDLRSYSAAEIEELIGRAGLRVEAVYGYDGKPAVLHGPERALWLVLKK